MVKELKYCALGNRFYWQPTRTDLVNILHQMYRVCGLFDGQHHHKADAPVGCCMAPIA
jgi:hypothetical protein